MGCASSAPAVLVPQQPPATYLIESMNSDGEATFSTTDYEKSRQGELIPIMDSAEKVLAKVAGRTFKQSSTSFKEADALAHLTPIKSVGGKLITLIVPAKLEVSHSIFNFSSIIYSAVPREDGLAVGMTHEGVPLYPWATVTPRGGGMSLSADISLAAPGGGFVAFAKISFTAFNNNLHSGKLVLPNGAACAKFARAGGGKMDYTAAAGVDAGLLVAAHIASVKNVRDSDQRGA